MKYLSTYYNTNFAEKGLNERGGSFCLLIVSE